MQEKMSLEEMVKLALEKAENAEKKAAEAERKLAEAETRAQRAEAYMEIKNVWAAHAYCYRAQQQRYEIENFWAKEHDDIMYAHGNMAFVGKETVLNYYAKGNEVMNEGKLKLACELFPDKIENNPENIGVGDLVARLQATPYIQIAKDGKTAKGIWYVLGYNVEMDRKGEPDVMLLLGKECVDFIKENDGWKIWHFRDSGDFMGRVNDTFLKTILESRPFMDPGKDEPVGRTVEGAFPKANRKIYDFAEESIYSVLRAAKFSPEIPEPYDTWTDEMSYALAADKKK